MKVVVAGANGLIGSHLVRALRKRGDTVVALVRDARGSDPAEVRSWDGKSQGRWAGAVDGADAVVCLAGAPVAKRWTSGHKAAIRASRVEAVRALVEAMRAASRRPRAFVSGSAVGYYGFRGDALLDESAAAGDDFLAGVCVAWEGEARGAEALGVRTVLLRSGVILARDGGALGRMLLPFRAFVGGPVGDGRQWLSWIHIDDEIGLILHAIDREVRGPMNATAPEPATMRDFAKALGKALGRPSWLPVPGFALRLGLGEMSSMLTESQRAVPKAALESGYTFRFPTLASALADLFGGARASA